MSAIPATLRKYLVSSSTLEATRAMLAERGTLGLEAAVLWTGRVIDDHTARVDRVHRPEQIAYVTEHGLAVEITQDGLTDVIATLEAGVVVLVRLHTHGDGDTRHSTTDDRNLVIAHDGAISIVVPHFAAHKLDLAMCGVHELRRATGWHRLSADEIGERFVVDG